MKKLLIVFLLFISIPVGNLLAQKTSTAVDIVGMTRMRAAGINTFDSRDRSIDGSYLLFDDWKTAILLLKDSSKIKVDFFNYNLKENHLNFKTPAEEFSAPTEAFESFSVENKKDGVVHKRDFVFLTSENDEVRLLEIMTEGDYSLYRRHDLSITKASYNTALDQGSLKDKVIKKYGYYLRYGKSLVELPKSRKKAIKSFSHLKKLSKYLRTHKIDMKNEIHLIELSNYLNLNQ